MADRPRSVGLVAVALALFMAGCGSGGGGQRHAATSTPKAATRTPKAATRTPRAAPAGPGTIKIPTPAPTGRPADPSAVKVIEGWSSALRRGDVRAAARFFALPSMLINGIDGAGQPLVLTILTSDQALAANATLPCGAKFISADQRGRYVNALFRLTGRPGPGGSNCGGGPGQTARTNFLIAHGRIVKWIRAPDDPGDNGGQAAPQPAPSPQPPQNQPGGVPIV